MISSCLIETSQLFTAHLSISASLGKETIDPRVQKWSIGGTISMVDLD